MFANRKHLLLFVLLALILSVAWVSSAHAADQDVTLAGREFFPGKGLVFYFHVDPGFDVDGAAKYVIIDGVRYDLTCRLREDGLLACLADAPRSVIGKDVEVHFGPYTFDTVVPEAHIPPGTTSYCYPVYDYGPDVIPWGKIGKYCQDEPASEFDAIDFYNPNYNDTFEYLFVLDGSTCGAPDFGPGYYYCSED